MPREGEPNSGGVFWDFFKRTINITEYLNDKDDVNPPKNRTLDTIVHYVSIYNFLVMSDGVLAAHSVPLEAVAPLSALTMLGHGSGIEQDAKVLGMAWRLIWKCAAIALTERSASTR
jgi:hypothetical protein